MVHGIDAFEQHFREYREQYAVIGGFACDLLMQEAGLDFRQTVDVDMVLIVEALSSEFAKAFWEFIEAGGYQARQRSGGKPEFYRFVNPTNPDYPGMLELFSRPQNYVVLEAGTHLMPLHIDDEISSLSAILLNDAYYELLLHGRTGVHGITVLDAEHLIPFKMKAWLDLTEKKAEGLHVDSRDIRKHRADVFRLYQLVRPAERIPVSQEVLQDIHTFILKMQETEIRLKDTGVRESKAAILTACEQMYVLKEE